MNRWTQLAAAAVIALAFAGGVLLLAPGKAVAFADVKKQIQEATSMSYTMHVDMAPQPVTLKVMFRLPGQMRQETADNNMVSVFDVDKHKAVTVLHKEKIAVVMDLGDLTDLFKQKMDSAQPFKELLDGQKEDLGRKEIDGKTLQGYRLRQSGQTMNLWVDPTTGQPFRIDLPDLKATITDIAINPKLDDSLFALDVPAGYKVDEQKMDLGHVTEKDFVEGMETLAKLNGGTFPDQPTFTPAMLETLKKAQDQGSGGPAPTTQQARQSKEEGLRFGKGFARMLLFMAQTSQAGGKFDYFGGGVRLGDKSTPIAWWRAKDAKAYRVLYGDLHLGDADPAKLPTTRPAAK